MTRELLVQAVLLTLSALSIGCFLAWVVAC